MSIVGISEIFQAPTTWHLGYDLLFTIIGAIVVLHMFIYAHKLYALTYKRTVLFMSLAFLGFGIKYVLTFIGRFVHYTTANIDATPLADPLMYKLFMWFIVHGYTTASIGAILLLLFAAWKVTRIEIAIPITLGILLLMFVIDQRVSYIIAAQAILLAVLTAKTISNAINTGKVSSWWYAGGITLLLISVLHYYGPWSFHFIFTSEIVLSTIGFIAIFESMRQARLQARRKHG